MYSAILGVVSAAMLLAYALYYRFGIKGSKIQFSLYLYMAMFPLNLGLLPVPGSQYADVLLKTMLLVGFALSLQRIARHGKVRVNLYEIGMLAAVLLTGLLNGAALDARSALYFPGVVNLGFQLVLSFHLLNSVREPGHFRQVAVAIVANSAVLCVLAIYERFVLGVMRPEVTLRNPNYFGLYVLLGLLCYWFVARGRRLSLPSVTYQALAIAGIVLSGSSAVLAALLIAVLVRLTGVARSRILDGLLVTAMVGVVVFYLATTLGSGDTTAGLLQYFVKQDDLSRIYIWKSALDAFVLHPLAGVGYATFRAPFSGFEYVTHNDYLRVLAELGLMGAVVFGLYIQDSVRRAVNSRNHHARAFVLSTVLATLLFSLTHNNMNSITFWLFLSLPYYMNVLGSANSARGETGDGESLTTHEAVGGTDRSEVDQTLVG